MSTEPTAEPPANGHAAPPADQPGLQARLAEVIAERNSLRAAATEGAAHKARADEAVATLERERAAWSEDRDLMRAGLIEDEARDVARMLWQRLPAEGRPKVGEWVSGMRAEGATVPRALAPYLTAPAGQPAVPKAPPPPAGTGQQPPSSAPVTGDALRAAREAWERAGRPMEGPTHQAMVAVTKAAQRRT
jgi:hypothetical protein